ncbi:MAG: hypothetical protein ABLQ96_04690 [Candidatus Acidiferrum sp.]
MPSRGTIIHLVTKAGILFGALFLVGVLLAAIPAHKSPALQNSAPQESQSAPPTAHSMPGMDMDEHATDEHSAAAGAVHEMTPGGHDPHSLHMYMTAPRPQTSEDLQRANEIVSQLRGGIEKYRDYHVALDDSFKIFLPNVPQPEYHFTKMKNGFLEAFTFDASRPTSLLYKKTSTGYELVGAMYTMPKRASEDQLNARVPLSIASWHLHTNLCMPPRDQRLTADYTKFGLKGSIATQDACDAAGGRFLPNIFGWMVHVYPYEDTTEKIFAMHHHMD